MAVRAGPGLDRGAAWDSVPAPSVRGAWGAQSGGFAIGRAVPGDGESIRRQRSFVSSHQGSGNDTPVERLSQLVEHHARGEKPRAQWKIGTEHEKFAFSRALSPLAYEGSLDDPKALVGREAATRRTVDLARAGQGPAGMRFGLALTCRLRADLSEEEDALLVEERCRGDARFTNRFWADPRTGAVFRSEQWIGEQTAPLRLEVLGTGAEAEGGPAAAP